MLPNTISGSISKLGRIWHANREGKGTYYTLRLLRFSDDYQPHVFKKLSQADAEAVGRAWNNGMSFGELLNEYEGMLYGKN